MQQALSTHRRFFHKWKIKVNSSKTEAIIITKRRPDINVNITFDNTNICWLEKVKYLGVILDAKLNFGPHINYVTSKAIANLISLYPIFKNKFLSKYCKINLYKSLVLPGMLYACPIWSFTCESNVNKIQVTQNKFLRIIGNYRKFTQISTIHDELKVVYVKARIKKLTENYFTRIVNHNNKLVKNIVYDKTAVFRHTRIMHII